MTEEIKLWEYRVRTIGSVFGTKDENIEATLNEWGAEGWEATQVYTQGHPGGPPSADQRLTPSALTAELWSR